MMKKQSKIVLVLDPSWSLITKAFAEIRQITLSGSKVLVKKRRLFLLRHSAQSRTYIENWKLAMRKFIKAGITPRIIQLLKDNKEEAEFSKMLATIRRDAPITFTLPEKTFKESLAIKKVTKL